MSLLDAVECARQSLRQSALKLWDDGPAAAQGPLGGPAAAPWDVSQPVTFNVPTELQQQLPDPPSAFELRRQFQESVRESLRAVGSGEAPPCKTGAKFTVHGATVTVWAHLDEVANLMCGHYLQDFCPFTDDAILKMHELGPTQRFERRFQVAAGVFVLSGPRLGGDYCSIDIKGEAFEVFGMVPFQKLLQDLLVRDIRWHLTRVDPAFDGAPFTPLQFKEAVEAGDVRSLTTRDTLDWRSTPLGPDKGDTCTFGHRGSDGFLRVYNRRRDEQGDPITRVELECRGDRAKLVGLALVGKEMQYWPEVCMTVLRSFVDLVDRSSDKCVTRCRPLSMWAAFVGDVQRIKLKLTATVQAFKENVVRVVQKVDRLQKRAVGAIGTLHQLLGGYFESWIARAVDEFKTQPRHAYARARAAGFGQILGIDDEAFSLRGAAIKGLADGGAEGYWDRVSDWGSDET